MLGESCPVCGTPLFQMKNGDTICPMCKRPVRFVEAGADEQSMAQKKELEATLNVKVDELRKKIESEDDPIKLGELTDTLMKLLDAVDRVKN